MKAERGHPSVGLIALWVLAIFCAFLVLTCAVWLFATPTEHTTIVTDTNGRVVGSRTEDDLSSIVLPAVFLIGSVVCLAASVIGLWKVQRRKKAAA